MANVQDELIRKLYQSGGGKTNLTKSQISAITLGILSADDIKIISVANISSEELKPDADDVRSLEGTLYDPRLGTIDNNTCHTCHGDVLSCLGHIGYIEIKPDLRFIHQHYITLVARLLGLFCYGCRDEDDKLVLLVPKEEIEQYMNLSYTKRLKAIEQGCKKGCQEHQARKYEVKRDKNKSNAYIQYSFKKTATALSLDQIEELLMGMRDEDLSLLGIEGVRPENFIVKVVPVLPIAFRPYNVQEGMMKHNDITNVYKEIIAANNAGEGERLRLYYSGLIDNKQGKCKSIHSNAYVTFKSLIDTKTGLMRNVIGGKRGNFCGRTVISPDPNINVWEVGMPEEMANTLTTEETVTRFNIDAIKKMILSGGVKTVIHKGTKMLVSLIEDLSTIEIIPGDKVKRFLVDGDPVLLNRQPGLHKQSLIGLTVRRLPCLTLRLNPSICTCLNADFHGDESNITVPQSYMAKAEALYVMNIKNCMISDQTGKVITGIVQDPVLGSYKISADDVVVKLSLWSDCIFKANREHMVQSLRLRCQQLNVNPYSGKSLFSVLFPEDFVYSRQSEGKNISIINGILVECRLTREVLSSGHNSIVQTLHKRYGNDTAAEFSSNLQFLVNLWLAETGFSVGYADCQLKDSSDSRSNSAKDAKSYTEEKIKEIVKNVKKEAMSQNQDPLLALKHEAEINRKLNSARDTISKIVMESGETISFEVPRNTISLYATRSNGKESLPLDIKNITMDYTKDKVELLHTNDSISSLSVVGLISITVVLSDAVNSYHYIQRENPLVSMLQAQSKGSKLNISKISGIIGQQNLSGQRIPFSITNNTRVTPHFVENDSDPLARGFCSSFYNQGMSPLEFYMHAIASREGLTDTAVKTSETGYLQRRLGKVMEGLSTRTDGSVRSETGQIIQYQYGGHGFSADKMINIDGLSTFTNLRQRISEFSPSNPSQYYGKVFSFDVSPNSSLFVTRTTGDETLPDNITKVTVDYPNTTVTLFHDNNTKTNLNVSGLKSITHINNDVVNVYAYGAPSKFAYVFFISSPDAISGVAVAARSLRLTKTPHDIVLVSSFPLNSTLRHSLKQPNDYNIPLIDRVISYVGSNLSFVLSLTEYDKILLCSPRLLFLKNVDSLFSLASPAATFSRPSYQPYNPSGIVNPYIDYQSHGSIIPNSLISDSVSQSQSYSPLPSLVLLSPDDSIADSIDSSLAGFKPIQDYYILNDYDWTNISQVYQYSLTDPSSQNWLLDSDFSKKTVFAWSFALAKEPVWKMNPSFSPDVNNWFRFIEDLRINYPILSPFLVSSS